MLHSGVGRGALCYHGGAEGTPPWAHPFSLQRRGEPTPHPPPNFPARHSIIPPRASGSLPEGQCPHTRTLLCCCACCQCRRHSAAVVCGAEGTSATGTLLAKLAPKLGLLLPLPCHCHAIAIAAFLDLMSLLWGGLPHWLRDLPHPKRSNALQPPEGSIGQHLQIGHPLDYIQRAPHQQQDFFTRKNPVGARGGAKSPHPPSTARGFDWPPLEDAASKNTN